MLIIKGKYVLTEDGLKENWGIGIHDGIIVELGPMDAFEMGGTDEVIDARTEIVAPGFINAHNHMYGSVSHGIHTDKVIRDFTDFLNVFWWPMVEDQIDEELIRATTAWACIEAIDSGVTTMVDILEAPNTLPGCLGIEKEVIDRFGLRAYLSFEASQRQSEENGRMGLSENHRFSMDADEEDLVQGFMSIHTLFTCDENFICKAKSLAEESGSLFHMHLSESVYEPNWTLERYGKRPVEVYEDWRLLDSSFLASQVVQVDDAEKALMISRDAAMIHMPLSNCEVGGGIAPYPDFVAAGCRVGLGSDGYINNFFEIMRGAFLIHKAHLQDPQIMKGREVFQMATKGGADALGRKDLGRIAIGAKADIITIDLDTPTPINPYNIYDQLILYRNPANVVNVLVNGRILKKDGRLVDVDVATAKEQLRKVTQKLWDKQ